MKSDALNEGLIATPASELRVKPATAIVWSSLGFALLQSICVAIIAVSGIRTAIGLSSLLLAGGIYPAVMRLHADAIRIPMMIFAFVGSVVNLAVLGHLYRLRHRPAARWRTVPVGVRQQRLEHMQIILSLLTLALLAVEFVLHRIIH